MKKYLLPSIFFLFFLAATYSFAQDYIVGEGDVLKITVYDHDDLTTTVRVSGESTIAVPLIGQVEVTGLSVSRISEKLQTLFADGYIINPQVTIFIEEFRSQKATVLGQVNRPGLYELREHTTLLELISKAGGFTANAGNTALIKRKQVDSDDDDNIIKIDLKRLVEKGDTSLNIPVKDGDSIYVTKVDVIYISGQVRKPAAYKYDEATTVIKAITMAGGFTDKASPTNIKIIRKTNGKEKVLTKVKMDKPVLPDDIIVVPESFF